MGSCNYCSGCGCKVEGEPTYCVQCGKNLKNDTAKVQKNEENGQSSLSNIEIELRYSNSKKSVLAAFLLTLFLGPLGLFYVSEGLAFFLMIAPFVIALIFNGAGVSWVETLIVFQVIGCLVWLISILSAIVQTESYNTSLMKKIKGIK